MKRFLLTIFAVFALLAGVTTTNAQVKQSTVYRAPQPQEYIYRDLGLYQYNFPDGSLIALQAFITKSVNNSGLYGQYRYVYTLKATSKSVYAGYYRATWLYNTRVFVNGVEASGVQYPQGFTVYVRTTPTIVYYWYTNDEEVPSYYFNWANSAYER